MPPAIFQPNSSSLKGANPEHLPEESKAEDCGKESYSSYHKCDNPELTRYGSE
jgi:hypothetical protein